MLEQLTAAQISEWEAFDSLEPIGKFRDDYRTALLCSIITNIARALWGKKGTKMSTIEEFLLRWDAEEKKRVGSAHSKRQSLEEMKTMLLAIKGHYNKVFEREKK